MRLRLFGISAMAVVVTLSSGLASASGGRWAPAGRLNKPRAFTMQALLPGGRLLVAGGVDGPTVYHSAEIYDPSLGEHGKWTLTGSMAKPRTTTEAVMLQDGRVLVPGGQGPCCKVYASAEVYDPASGKWSSAGTMTRPRNFATVTLLEDGRVLVAGGSSTAAPGHPDKVLASAEIYDPATGVWSRTGSMQTPRECAAATRLQDGRVLVAGGRDGMFNAYRSAEIYDPQTGTWSAAGNMARARSQQGAALLSDGRVFEVGGFGNGYLASAELFDPVSKSWSSAGVSSAARRSPIVAELKDGTVLVAGGFSDSDVLASADLYTPSQGGAGAWSGLPDMPGPRADGVGLWIRGGHLVVAGGFDAEAHDAPTDAFAYVP